jgi:two-component system OmpR family response regulator
MRVLVVEDAEKLALGLKRGLEDAGYAVDVLFDGVAARKRLIARADDYDVLVLVIMLPGVDGLTLCRNLRDRGLTLPVLMLTARDTTDDKVRGLDTGADDYLVKPFAFQELLARIRTLLRRPAQILPTELRVDDLVLDPASRAVRRGDQPIELSTKEFALLELFMRSPGRILSRDHILDHVWNADYDSFSNVIDVYVARLRKKVDRRGQPSLFRTVRGVGYGMRA